MQLYISFTASSLIFGDGEPPVQNTKVEVFQSPARDQWVLSTGQQKLFEIFDDWIKELSQDKKLLQLTIHFPYSKALNMAHKIVRSNSISCYFRDEEHYNVVCRSLYNKYPSKFQSRSTSTPSIQEQFNTISHDSQQLHSLPDTFSRQEILNSYPNFSLNSSNPLHTDLIAYPTDYGSNSDFWPPQPLPSSYSHQNLNSMSGVFFNPADNNDAYSALPINTNLFSSTQTSSQMVHQTTDPAFLSTNGHSELYTDGQISQPLQMDNPGPQDPLTNLLASIQHENQLQRRTARFASDLPGKNQLITN